MELIDSVSGGGNTNHHCADHEDHRSDAMAVGIIKRNWIVFDIAVEVEALGIGDVGVWYWLGRI